MSTTTQRCAPSGHGGFLRWRRVPWPALVLGFGAAVAAAEPGPDADPQTGLVSWRVREGALSVQLTQLLPDQTRAFFQGRGFTVGSADAIATACVLQAIVSNAAEGERSPEVAIDLERWRIDAGEEPVALAVESSWQPRWGAAGESQAARVAFRWALFPTRQTFKPGDHGWGMIAFGLAPGKNFDLTLVWQEDGVDRTAAITAVQCAPDRSIEPTENSR